MNKKILKFALPLLVIILYCATIYGMRFAESRTTNLYQQYTLLLEQSSHTRVELRETLLQNFTNHITLGPTEKNIFSLSLRAQRIVDSITLGKKHCLTTPGATECKTYTSEVIDSAIARRDTLVKLTHKNPAKESILYGTPYGPLDYLVKVASLLVEAIILSELLIWLLPKIKVKE